MNFKDIAVISGKGGLYRILKPTRTGVIVEAIDDKKSRFPVNASNRISVLEEISVYTTTADGSTPLKDVLRKIYEEFKEDPGVTSGSDPDELKAFLQHITPDYDEEKVYVSDIKKIVGWYHILLKYHPDIFTQTEEEGEEEEKKEDKKSQPAKPKAQGKPVAKHAEGGKAKPGKAKAPAPPKRSSPQSKSK